MIGVQAQGALIATNVYQPIFKKSLEIVIKLNIWVTAPWE